MREKQMTVGELKKILEGYPEDIRVFVEPENVSELIQGNTLWAQRVLRSYCTKEVSGKDALMLVGDWQ